MPGVNKANDKKKKDKKLQRTNTDAVVRNLVTKRPEIPVNDPLVANECAKFVREKSYHVQNILRAFDSGAGAEALKNAIATVKKKVTGGGINSKQKAEWLATAGDMTAWHNVLQTTTDADVSEWSEFEHSRAMKRGEELLEGCTHWPSLNKMSALLASEKLDFPLGATIRPKMTKLLAMRAIAVCSKKRKYNTLRGTVLVQPLVEDEVKTAKKNATTNQEPAPVFDEIEDVINWLGKYPRIQANLGSFYTKMTSESAVAFATTLGNYLINPANKPEQAGYKFVKALQPIADEAAYKAKRAGQDQNLAKAGRGEQLTAAEKTALKNHTFSTSQILCAISGDKILSLLCQNPAGRTSIFNRVKPYLTAVQNTALGQIDAEMRMFQQMHLGSGRDLLYLHVLNVDWDKKLPELKKHVEVVDLAQEMLSGMVEEYTAYAEAAKNYATTGSAGTQAQTSRLKASATIIGSYIAAHGSVVLLLKPNPTPQMVGEVTAQMKEAIPAFGTSKDHIATMQHLGDCVEAWMKRTLEPVIQPFRDELNNLANNQHTTLKQMADWLEKWRATEVVWAMSKIDLKSANNTLSWLEDETHLMTKKYLEANGKVERRMGVPQAAPAAVGAVMMDEGGDL
mmetsp:Transcript_13238/g.32316  ORF Transcript_13238/g.32316 Transcript_13238/m.32316 type:complete len:624 (+) Transcript_13238:765-2636(+)|eukprot:CAMPEP_0178988176 /NCGR_PEP_ID=MMETSP0795-20121207/3673_1 /TAXON_ID=88552 /ORGANISM="Amoebophrya sp., Strain Ameob2" /LENGTH=623 /DNA_ID=CAMNT_0020679437 /DNA_START=728 /DNA_END=2599 /DNA_ORIENTATION=+